jgi:hypothetical protein
MFVATIPNRDSPAAYLLRETYREGGKVKSRTLANLSHLPAPVIGNLRRAFRGETLAAVSDIFHIERSLPHGHVAAVLGTLQRLGLERIVGGRPSRSRALVLAMIVARVIDPRSKLATARGLGDETAFSTLGTTLKVASADADELYAAMSPPRLAVARTGCCRVKAASRPSWPGNNCKTARWCCTTCRRPTSRAVSVRWPSLVIAGMGRRISCRSSLDCCATPRAARWRSRSSRGIPLIHARWRRRSSRHGDSLRREVP